MAKAPQFGKWAVFAAALLAVPGPVAGDWPQFRGARRDGVAAGAGPVAPWRGNPRVRWRAPLGEGYAGVTVAAGAVYTTYAGEDGEYVARFDDRDGREVWKRRIGDNFQAEFTNGPRATPAVDRDSVYVLGSLGNLVALSIANGEERWSVDLGQRFAAPPPRFGYASSPLLAGDLLLVQAGGEGRRHLAALDAKTGTVDWTVCADDAGYSSPIALTLNGEPQFVFITLKEILGVSPAGDVLWTFPWPGENNIAIPIFLPPNRLFASHNEDDGGLLLELTGGATLGVREVWRSRFLKNHFSSSVLLDGYLYGFDNATLRCIDAATGESRWAQRGLGKGSLIAAAGRLIVLGDLGDLVLAEASPAGYHELARAKVFEERSWTAPSLVGSRLYLRNQTELISYDLAGGENPQ